LLRPNKYPTNIQAAHCREIVSSAPGDLQQYDAEILRIKAVLEDVEHERALLDDHSRLCRYTISPFRRLPAEILTEIFDFFLPEVPDWPYAKHVVNIDLLRISHVCVRWHQLVLGTPSLW
ncbi:hypothetical protein C8R47DRAFT_939705, partial [Mycena vitilis]